MQLASEQRIKASLSAHQLLVDEQVHPLQTRVLPQPYTDPAVQMWRQTGPNGPNGLFCCPTQKIRPGMVQFGSNNMGNDLPTAQIQGKRAAARGLLPTRPRDMQQMPINQ